MRKAPDFEKARDYAIRRLENELSPNLTYHSPLHTLQEVVPAADRLAILEKVSHADRLLLLTAAYFHDLGFIYQRGGHESISIRLAELMLPGFGYSKRQLAVVRGIIQATCIPQSPKNILGLIMADADLDYLGSECFWERSIDLRRELANYGRSFTDGDWYHFQIDFIQAHKYFTASQRSMREAPKQQYLRELQARSGESIQVEKTAD